MYATMIPLFQSMTEPVPVPVVMVVVSSCLSVSGIPESINHRDQVDIKSNPYGKIVIVKKIDLDLQNTFITSTSSYKFIQI